MCTCYILGAVVMPLPLEASDAELLMYKRDRHRLDMGWRERQVVRKNRGNKCKKSEWPQFEAI